MSVMGCPGHKEVGVKRLFVFVVLGPLVGGSMLSLLYGSGSALGAFAAFPIAGLLSLGTAVIDHLLQNDRWRLGYVAALGYFLTALLFHSWLAGLAGCAAAVFCSWMANERWLTE
jgi:hypothetical protein